MAWGRCRDCKSCISAVLRWQQPAQPWKNGCQHRARKSFLAGERVREDTILSEIGRFGEETDGYCRCPRAAGSRFEMLAVFRRSGVGRRHDTYPGSARRFANID